MFLKIGPLKRWPNNDRKVNTRLFDFEIPESAIAQFPAENRGDAKLLVVDRRTQKITTKRFHDFPYLVPKGSALFRNNARVIQGRIHGNRPLGGEVECLLLRPGRDRDSWWCLLRPGRKLGPGKTFEKRGVFHAQVLEKKPSGEFLVQFSVKEDGGVTAMAEKRGEVPLPPYIRRDQEYKHALEDRERYQTVYSDPDKTVAAAAPTAGLHFTESILEELDSKKIQSFDLTLHIGLGTFQPINTEKIEDYSIHREAYEIPKGTLEALKKSRIGPRIAIGTTTVRALEDLSFKTRSKAIDSTSTLASDSISAEASLLIYPPFEFQNCQALLTNFHLPRSTLMCLVAAFLAPGSTEGISWLKEIYREALVMKYRFYSYGDAMLIL